MVSFAPQGVHDVRLAYIRFALSFLIAGDDSTIAQVLELKGRCASLSPSKARLRLCFGKSAKRFSQVEESLRPLQLPQTPERRTSVRRSCGRCSFDIAREHRRGIPVKLSGVPSEVLTQRCERERPYEQSRPVAPERARIRSPGYRAFLPNWL